MSISKDMVDHLLPIIKTESINLKNIKDAISYVDEISDSTKLCSLLIALSNDEKTKHGVTKINLFSLDATAKVIICGEPSIINVINKEKNYNHYLVKSLIYNLINKDHSNIIEPRLTELMNKKNQKSENWLG